jgi:hypothetical protein
MSPWHRIEKALHDEDCKGQLEGDQHENDPEERVQKTDPIEHQEYRHDQGQHRKGMQHQQRTQHRGAARKLESRQVVGRERRYGHHDGGLRPGDQQRIAEGSPHARELNRAVHCPDTGSHRRGEIGLHQEDEIT